MTDTPEPLGEPLDEHDVTLAFTPGQLLLMVIGVLILLRILRGLKR